MVEGGGTGISKQKFLKDYLLNRGVKGKFFQSLKGIYEVLDMSIETDENKKDPLLGYDKKPILVVKYLGEKMASEVYLHKNFYDIEVSQEQIRQKESQLASKIQNSQ